MSSPYRHRVVPETEQHVVSYGPFPRRWLPLLGAGMCLFLGAVLSLVGWDQGVLRCERAADSCTYHRTTLVKTRTRSFSLSELRGVQVRRVTSNKSVRGQVELDLGARRLLFSRTSVQEAESTAAQLRAQLRDQPPAFEVWQRDERWLGVVGILLLLATLVLASITLRDGGRFVFLVEGNVIRWARRFSFVPISRGKIDVTGARDIVVKWSARRHSFQHRNALPETYGQLRWVKPDGSSEPIGPRAFRGHTVHIDAAQQLRQALQLAPRSESQEREQRRLANAARPADAAPSTWSGTGGRIAAAWTGMCCGALLGMLLLGVVKIGFGISNIDDSLSGWDALIGAGGGAITGIVLALRLTRTQRGSTPGKNPRRA